MAGVKKEMNPMELGTLLGLSVTWIFAAIRKKELFYLPETSDVNRYLIDMGDSRNRKWLVEHDKKQLLKSVISKETFEDEEEVEKLKKKSVQNGTVVRSPVRSKVDYSGDRKAGKDEIVALEIKKRQLDIDRLKKTIRLDEIRVAKAEGSLIPYDAAQNLFMYAVETFRTSYMQEVKSLANLFVQKLGGSQRHFVEIQKEIGLIVEASHKEARENVITGLQGIVNEYKEVRNRGEKK
jgi:hypothetical protein